VLSPMPRGAVVLPLNRSPACEPTACCVVGRAAQLEMTLTPRIVAVSREEGKKVFVCHSRVACRIGSVGLFGTVPGDRP